MVPGPSHQFTPEERLLISLCRLEFTEKQKSEIRELVTAVKDWDRFINLANKHGIIALCWYNITETGKGNGIPVNCLSILHSAYLKSLAYNTRLYKKLEEIAEHANNKKIKIVLIKGIALEKILYRNKGLRQLSDIDILVQKDDAITLRNILIENGFDSLPLISPLHKKLMPYMKSHLPSLLKDGLLVEIHARLFENSGNTLTEDFINSSVDPAGDETTLYYPEIQMLFLYLVKHLVRHETTGVFQVKFYIDLYLLLLKYPDTIFNEQLLDLSVRADLKRSLIEKLAILETFWGLDLPVWIKTIAGEISLEESVYKFIRFFKYPEKSKSGRGTGSTLKPLQEIPGAFNKILFIAGYIFPSPEYMKYKYNIKTNYGALQYYPVRWIKTLKQLISM